MDKRLFNILGIVFMVGVTLVGVNVFVSGKDQKPAVSEAAPLRVVPIAQPVKTPKPTVPEVLTVTSPDGKMELMMAKLYLNPKNRWTFSVNDKKIFEVETPADTTFSMPQNAFSPDNKYFFVKEAAPSATSYIVLKAGGEAVTDAAASLEVNGLFMEKYPEFKVTDVTGWAAPGLLIVNADKAEGGQGPTFWFSVNTQGFTRLSTRFN